MTNTPRRTIRIGPERWSRWHQAVIDPRIRNPAGIQSITDLIIVSVERYLSTCAPETTVEDPPPALAPSSEE